MKTTISRGRVPGPRRRSKPTLELLEARLAPAVADIVLTLTGGASRVPTPNPGIFRIYGGITIEVVNNGPEAVNKLAIFANPPFFSGLGWTTEVSGGASVTPTSGPTPATGLAIDVTASLPVGGKVTIRSVAQLLDLSFT